MTICGGRPSYQNHCKHSEGLEIVIFLFIFVSFCIQTMRLTIADIQSLKALCGAKGQRVGNYPRPASGRRVTEKYLENTWRVYTSRVFLLRPDRAADEKGHHRRRFRHRGKGGGQRRVAPPTRLLMRPRGGGEAKKKKTRITVLEERWWGNE